jgi:hypothetical protein
LLSVMKRCVYCGKEYDDTATVCVVDRQPVVRVLPPPEGSSEQSNPSVEFLRLLFKSPKEEEFAVRCAQFLAGIVGERITLLRPDTKWSEIIGWSGPSFFHAAALAIALRKELGVDPKEILANPEFTTFRDFVEYACAREDKTA